MATLVIRLLGATTPPPEKDVVRWFKLLLLNQADLPKDVAESSHFQQAVCLQKKLKMNAEELVGCFLRSLWKHCMESINRALGKAEVDDCKIHIVMTVPAIWPHYVQNKMRYAANLAGMLHSRDLKPAVNNPTIQFLSEPEAAAMAALAEMEPRPNIKVSWWTTDTLVEIILTNLVQEGDSIIVCDAGGGTAVS